MPDPPPARRRPDADGRPVTARVVTFGIGTWSAIEWTFRNFRRVHLRSRRHEAERLGKDVDFLDRPQVEQVEDRAKVDVEALGPLAGKDAAAVGQRVDGRLGERAGVVRRGQRADVARRAGQVAAQVMDAPAVHPRDRVELLAVPGRAPERGDRRRVVEEGIRIADDGREPELVGDVRARRSRWCLCGSRRAHPPRTHRSSGRRPATAAGRS